MAAKLEGSLRERGANSWEYTYYVKDAAGKPAKRTKNFKGGKRDAQRQARELLAKRDAGILNATNATVGQLLDKYHADVVMTKNKPRTQVQYRRTIDAQIKPVLGDVKLSNLTGLMVHDFYQELGKKYAGNTVAAIHTPMLNAFKLGLRLGLISFNPVAQAERPSRQQKKVISPDAQAVRDTLDLARSEANEFYAAMHLAASCGMRRGEIMGLRWENVDLNAGGLRIAEQITVVEGEGNGATFGTPKTADSIRDVDLDDDTVEVLIQHRERQDETIRMAGNAYTNQGLVFADVDGGPIHPSRFYRAIKNCARRVGHPELTIHSLRHFHASEWIGGGGDVATISERLGHSNISITLNTYTHATKGRQREHANKMSAILRGRARVGKMSANEPVEAVTVSESA